MPSSNLVRACSYVHPQPHRQNSPGSKMVGTHEQIYLADSKYSVRTKLGMQGKDYDEDFSSFEVGLHLCN